MSTDQPKRIDGLLEHDLGNEMLLYDAEGRAIHVLNATGQVVWRMCDGEHSIEEIVRALAKQFSVEQRVDVDADVRTTLDLMQQKGLVE